MHTINEQSAASSAGPSVVLSSTAYPAAVANVAAVSSSDSAAPSLLGPLMDRRVDQIAHLRQTTIADATPGPARWRNFGGQYALFADYGARRVLLSADARQDGHYTAPVAFLLCNVDGRLESLDHSVVQTDRHPDLVLIATAFHPEVGLLACWEMLLAGRNELRQAEATAAALQVEVERLRGEMRTIAFQSSVSRPPSERLALIAEAARRALGRDGRDGEGQDA